MQAFLSGQDVTLTIPIVDAAGEPIDATGVEYRVVDQSETELIAKVALAGFNAGDIEALIVIPTIHNVIASPATRELRSVEVYVTSATGVMLIATEYVLELTSVIVAGMNSIQSYASAVLVGYELPNLSAWMSASKQERISALMAAYRNLGNLRLRYIADDVDAMTRVITPSEWGSNDVTKLGPVSLSLLSAEYRGALMRAQVLEADFLLGGDEVGDIRRSGIMSATIGESSQFFRTSKPLESSVCKRALKELSRYVVNSTVIGRA